MSEFEVGILLQCLEDTLAWENLHDPHLTCHMDADGVLDLARRAGYSEEAAQKIAQSHGWERLKRDLPP